MVHSKSSDIQRLKIGLAHQSKYQIKFREYHHVTSQRKEPYLMRFIKLAPINNNIKEETKTNETFFEDKGFFFDSFGDEFSEDLMFRDIW